jgi:hypothetical protein
MLFVVNVKYVDDLVILAKKEAALQAWLKTKLKLEKGLELRKCG